MAWYEHDRTPIRRCIHGCHMAPDIHDENKNPACSICRSKMLINRSPVKKTSIKKLIEPEVTENEIESEADHEAEPLEETIEELSEN
jgi:hypothetical protein